MKQPALALVVFLVAAVAHAAAPPSQPERLTPIGGEHLPDGPVRFTWRDSTDPQGEPLRYEVEVTEVVADGKSARRVAQATAGSGDSGVVLEGLPWGTLSWRLRAVDASGLASAWTEPPTDFTIQAPAAPASPIVESDGNAPGCSVTRGRRAGAPFLAFFALALVAVARRRRR